MARLSRATKDTIQTIAVLVLVALLIVVYVIYPLNRTKALMARPDLSTFKSEPLPANDPSAFVAAGLTVDTFRVEADGLTKLACIRVIPKPEPAQQLHGLAILIHKEGLDRTSLVESAKALADSGLEVVLYDQRATGLSTGKYRSDGQLETSDLEALVGYLEIQGRLKHPLTVIGWGVGGDAAVSAENDESRINEVVAIDPYLTTERMVQLTLKKNNVMWFPFNQTIFWWWYKIRSGYAIDFRTEENLVPVKCRTIIGLPADRLSDPEVRKLIEISSKELLTVIPVEQVDPVGLAVGFGR
ncbi:hypothetical protein C3F09_00730 [candidate division GN15 bacterium]|uniref:Serine aminopeptidase S33 domain-containing protein n=1 Tax=candidate division GN15 bacterium TaxID=2072418 RepID=A0A855XCS5_9BACT|nr:MAG: hypothetical protein C3F09_00730 [candidate division GN15 bacterium]